MQKPSRTFYVSLSTNTNVESGKSQEKTLLLLLRSECWTRQMLSYIKPAEIKECLLECCFIGCLYRRLVKVFKVPLERVVMPLRFFPRGQVNSCVQYICSYPTLARDVWFKRARAKWDSYYTSLLISNVYIKNKRKTKKNPL